MISQRPISLRIAFQPPVGATTRGEVIDAPVRLNGVSNAPWSDLADNRHAPVTHRQVEFEFTDARSSRCFNAEPERAAVSNVNLPSIRVCFMSVFLFLIVDAQICEPRLEVLNE